MNQSDFLFKDLTENDFENLQDFFSSADFKACDFNLVNLILFSKKNQTKICVKDGILYRIQKSKSENRNGFLFPLLKDYSVQNLKNALDFILTESKNLKIEPNLVLIEENQKNFFEKTISLLKNYKISWQNDEGDSDYIYLQKNLSNLSGKKLQKKKNHINQFYKIYSDFVKFTFVQKNDFSEMHSKKILEIYSEWKKNHAENFNEDLIFEEIALKSALQNFKNFNLKAQILEINEKPVAFALGNNFSSDCFDVIFEKAIQNFAQNGAYAVINQKFAENLSEYKFLNREEDLNVPSLRKAKLSYKPEIILKKYYGKIEYLS